MFAPQSPVRRALTRVAAVALTAGALAGLSGSDAAAARTPAPSASIALAQVNGRLAEITPTLGSTVMFAATYPNTVKNPRIEVLCYDAARSLIYGEAGGVKDAFLLGGSWSLWLERGGSAQCTANLYYFGSHAGKQTYNVLATTSFAAGS